VTVTGAPAAAELAGSAGQEPLHFAPDATSEVAWAGVAVDHKGAIALQIACRIGDRADTVKHEVAVRPGSYPTERLRVAPEFATRPDSALAARIERESARAREVAQRSHDTPRLWAGAWTRPRPSRVTSGYGRGRQFNGTITSRHMGTDFAGVTGARVVAANRGVVRIVDRFYYGGNVVYVDHGDGITTAYLHLSKQLVAEGDTVKAGQPIGHVGASGRVTGPHLHLIARFGTMSLDPLSLLGGAQRD
jgi:murein DD-endopeptidase MepM/ murein hydrolase activator NlpD